MELKFSELDNITSQNPYEQINNTDYDVVNNSDTYWGDAKDKKEYKKKRVSFNDILSNMNLFVNKKGALSTRTAQTNELQQQDYQYEEQYIPQEPQQKPIDPSVKHSYIYNKYFKDYSDVSAPIPEKKVPKTIEEYNQMVLEDRIKRIEERKRIAVIKSTKLMFTTTPDNNIIQRNPRNIQPSRNNLKKMSFW
jgi:hypothetical protein